VDIVHFGTFVALFADVKCLWVSKLLSPLKLSVFLHCFHAGTETDAPCFYHTLLALRESSMVGRSWSVVDWPLTWQMRCQLWWCHQSADFALLADCVQAHRDAGLSSVLHVWINKEEQVCLFCSNKPQLMCEKDLRLLVNTLPLGCLKHLICSHNMFLFLYLSISSYEIFA